MDNINGIIMAVSHEQVPIKGLSHCQTYEGAEVETDIKFNVPAEDASIEDVPVWPSYMRTSLLRTRYPHRDIRSLLG